MKKYKNTIILTTIISLIPILIGVLLWNKLPDTIATHFGNDNTPNGWSSKTFTVFAIPIFLIAIQLISIFIVLQDPKKKNISNKMLNIIFWMIPILSNVIMASTYAVALGKSSDLVGIVVNIGIGILFVAIGNYMPKTKQNYTVGIKIPWTLNSEENWNKTHRFSSKLFFLAGIAFILNGIFFINTSFSFFPFIFVALILLLPITYSFILYKKGI